MVANFWRAVAAEPETVAEYADWPCLENDLHARHIWLVGQKDGLQARLEGDPDYYDAKIAGWWVWGMALWIGAGFCSGDGPWQSVEQDDGSRQLVHLGTAGKGVNRQRVHLGTAGQGVNRQLVHLSDAGQGVNRKRVHLGTAGQGVNRKRVDLIAYMRELSDRLRNVRVCCGDWSRVCGPTPTIKQGLTAVVLDPPYDLSMRDGGCYNVDSEGIAVEVRKWAIEWGDHPFMRIALFGYADEHDESMPKNWSRLAWKANGGYGSQSDDDDGRGRLNSAKEMIWFSPNCLDGHGTKSLFE